MRKKRLNNTTQKAFCISDDSTTSSVIQEPGDLVRNVVTDLSIISISSFYALKKNKEMRTCEEKVFKSRRLHILLLNCFLLSHDLVLYFF